MGFMEDMLGGVRPEPLPGDPEVLAQDAAMYVKTADAIQDAIARIGQLASDGFSSDAVTALHGAQGDTVEDISKAFARYRVAGDALTSYATQLREAQDEANDAIRTWDDAEGQLQHLHYAVEDATQRAQTPGPDQPMAAGDLARLQGDAQSLMAAKTAAVQRWAEAAEKKRAAARATGNIIDAGNQRNDLNDDLWDDLGDIVDVINVVNAFIREVLKIVSLIMTILAIVFAIASLFFQPFAAVAAALFGYAQLVNLAIALLALLQFFMDGFHLMDLVVVGVALLAAFGGAAVGKVLGAATNAAVGTALAGFGEAASKAAGEAASQAVKVAVKEVTDEAVEHILDLGSDDAKAMYSDLSPAAGGFLNSAFSGQIGAATSTATEIGGWVGGDFRDGIAATGLPDLANGAMAGAGQVLGPVFDRVGGAVQQIDTNVQAAQNAAASATHDLGGGLVQQGAQLGSDLSSSFKPDLGRQVTDLATNLGGRALNELPGGSAISHIWGNQIGQLSSSIQTAANQGGVPAQLAGTR